jgi:Flp pilus assembly protein TadG
MNRIVRKSRGQVMVLYAFAIAGLLAAVALGTDVAVMYVNWQRAQKVADAAALAGANYLGGGITYTGTATTGCAGESSTDPATVAACTYAVNNGLDASTITISEPTASTIKVVATQSSLPYFFGNVIGTSNYSVSATAVANSPGPVGTVGQGLFPVGLQCSPPCTPASLVAGQPVHFGDKFVSVGASGNWQFLDSGSGAQGLENALANGMPGSYSIGDTIKSEPGNKGNSGPVKQGLNSRLNSCPAISDPCGGGFNPSNIPAGDPCLVVTPIVNYNGCTGSCTMTILGFAEVYLEPASTTSTSINGCFVTSNVGDTVTSSTAQNFGPQAAPTLIQ